MMKVILFAILVLAACHDVFASTEQSEEELFGARFKEGKGVELSATMRKSLGVETTEAEEKALETEVVLQIQLLSKEPEAEGLAIVSSSEAGVRPGITLAIEKTGLSATVKTIEPMAGGKESEVIFRINGDTKALSVGASFEARAAVPSSALVTVIPREALLTAAAGTFVYVVNGAHYLRTEVKVGKENESFVEITEGLYSGDVVVKKPVNFLWYAELQAVRGGVGCADGH